MDNQDSTWLNRQGLQKPYLDFGLAKPTTPLIAPIVERIGPIALNDSQGSLVSRWWACWQDGGNVVIAGANSGGTGYDAETIVFAEASTIEQITLTFDPASGRPLVFTS